VGKNLVYGATSVYLSG